MKRLMSTVLAAALVIACGGDGRDGDTSAAGGAVTGSGVSLTGAGATFPYPIYSKWISDYARNTGVKINYQSIGSGGGIRQLSEQTVDFGASDSPMTDEELSRAKGGPVLHIPMVMGAVVLTYNLVGVNQQLTFTGDVISDIYMGRITRWNDPRIAAINNGVQLPATDIVVVYRSDGSGTTYVFTDYLAAVSPAWKNGPGRGKEVQWPVGLGAKGNEGVAGQVKQTPGTIGYVELAYAKQNKLAYARVRSAAGESVDPTIESVSAAAASVVSTLDESTDYRVSIVNAPGKDSYPISSFTWILVYRDQADADKGKKLVDFLRWAVHEGGPSAAALDYAPLPEVIVNRLDARLASIKIGPAA
ncbi:MAG: phosphate ABC transporter substrate-binding protein PstS [Gemmatimonadaceae bacterium]